MTHSKLMKAISEGRMEVDAWEGTGCGRSQYAMVTVYPSNMNKRPVRKQIEITNIPEDFRR
ncbi:MAG: hypothetical protein JW943_07825 [Deltaproteobacteria bacterium]|nr:hypothetical protein [Deltaproteobacteria bacterium]